MERVETASRWSLVEPLPGPNWYVSVWSDGAGTFWLTGLPSFGRPAPIARSTDGGHTWALEDLLSRRSHTRVRGAPGGEPWVIGERGMVVTRRDGTWKRVRTGLKGWVHGLWCPSPETVYLTADGAIARTHDAGRTWSFTETTFALSTVVGDGAGSFVAAGKDGVILRSDDGARWSVTREAQPMKQGNIPRYLRALATFAPGCFVAAGDDAVLRSDDGGRTWRDVTPQGLREVMSLCVTASVTWFVGALERIVRSDDRGATWVVEHAHEGPGHAWVYALDVDADGRGFAVGPHNTGYLRAAD
ncbi:MAG: hypothetical protein R3A52_02320 [Polyangiales bacterium]